LFLDAEPRLASVLARERNGRLEEAAGCREEEGIWNELLAGEARPDARPDARPESDWNDSVRGPIGMVKLCFGSAAGRFDS